MKVSDDKILERFANIPDIEMFLEQDIISESFLDNITNQFLEIGELAQFEFISIDTETKE